MLSIRVSAAGVVSLVWPVRENREPCKAALANVRNSFSRRTNPRSDMLKLAFFLRALMVVLVCAPLTSVAQGTQASRMSYRTGSIADSTEQLRLARLATLGDIWTKLELYHPVLQVRSDINWDSALVRAIRRVDTARSTADFVRIINDELFTPLGDPLSYARTHVEADRRDSQDVPGGGRARRLQRGILYVDARDPAEYASPGYIRRLSAAILEQAPSVEDIVVVDVRWQRKEPYDAAGWLSLWTYQSSPTGIRVSRLHRGHVAPTRWQVEPAGSLSPPTATDSGAPMRAPTVFLVNLSSHAALDRQLDALQRRADVAVVLERSGPLAESWSVLTYPELVRVRIQSPMLVAFDGGLGARADTVLPQPLRAQDIGDVARVALRAARGRAVRPPFTFPWRPLPQYAEQSEPLSREMRLLGLVRLWKEVAHFSAYLPYASIDWSQALPAWIPQVEASASTTDYYRTLRRLIATLNDSHASVHHPSVTAPFWTIPALLRRLDDKVIVVHVDSTVTELAVGDEIIAVDGMPVRAVEDTLGRYRSASHRGAHFRNVWEIAEGVRGDRDTPVRLTVAAAAGPRQLTLLRSADIRTLNRAFTSRGAIVRRLAGNLGYIDLYRVTTGAMLDSALTELAATNGLVLDARRGGPLWTDADIRNHVVSRFLADPIVEPKGGLTTRFMHGGPPVQALEQQEMTYVPYRTERRVRYSKPIVVLIGARNQSYGESVIWPLKLGQRAKFIGQRTAGTNGGAPAISLPGGGYAIFTHERVTYPGGGRFHGIGIEPDVEVVPTQAGLRAGRDEVLESGVKLLSPSLRN